MLYRIGLLIGDIPKFFIVGIIGLGQCLGVQIALNAQEISIYYDSEYVDNCSNNTCEAFTLLQYLNSLSYNTETFAGIDSNSFFGALSCREVFFLPETEAGNFAEDVEEDAKMVIRDFVETGGLMFVMGSDGLNTGSSNSADNMNSIFGFNISNDLFTSSGFSYQNSAAGVSYLNVLPDSIRNFTTTNFISDLPVRAEVLFESEDGNPSVVDIPYGNGHIVFLGWSFFNGGPIGSQGPDRWSILIQSLITALSSDELYPSCTFCDNEPPKLKEAQTRDFSAGFDSRGIYRVTTGEIVSRYEDNCDDFSLRFITNQLLNCSNGFDQEVVFELEDEAGNVNQDTAFFSISDTTAPVFSAFPADVTVECDADIEPVNKDTLEFIEFVDVHLELDELSIEEIPLQGWRLPSGTNIERTEVLVEGEFNSLEDLWIRVRAVPGGSSLLINGKCPEEEKLNVWFSIEGSQLDCSSIDDELLYNSENNDLDVFTGNPVDSFVFDILNLGNLEGKIERLGLRFIYQSDLSFPVVEEFCGFNIEYTDTDNRGDCPIGVINRRFEVTDNFGNTEVGFQTVTVVDSRPVDIQWPQDYFVECRSGINLAASLHPDSLSENFSYPIVNNACLEYDMSYSDDLVQNCGVHDQRYIRRWVVRSECDPDNIFSYTQQLGILDTSAPEVLPLDPYQVAVDNETCIAGTNFFFPSKDSVQVLDCDEDPFIEMRVIDSSGIEFIPTELGVGNYFVEVSATDDCGNRGIQLIPVEFIDLVPPEIVCIDTLNGISKVVLGNDGKAQLCGGNLIDQENSEENCGMAGYDVNFTQSFNGSLECLELDCDDLGIQEVFVRGEDLSGNQDFCSTFIEIIDNTPPTIVCSDIILPCDAPFDSLNFPPPLAVDNCGNVDSFQCTPFRFVGSFCDSVYERSCRAFDRSGKGSVPCIQTLRRVDTSAMSIDWPESLIELDCNADPSPEFTGRPEVLSSCTPYDIQYQDNRSILCGNPELFKIERRWFVRNQCNQDLETFDQEIEVTDLDPPVFTHPTNPYVEFIIPDFSCDMIVDLEVEAIDDCSSVLSYSNSITGSGSLFSQRLERGEHEVVFYATDLCGNTDSLTVTIAVVENKNPFVECKTNQDFYLNQVEFVDIYPEEMIASVLDLCSSRDNLEFYISKVLDNGQDIGRQPFIRYRCDDLGINKLRLFARDEDGNIGSCDVNVQIIDTLANCANGDFFDISGRIFNRLRNPIGGAVALLNENRYQGRNHGLNGEYTFRGLPKDSCYFVSVMKDSSASNGITAMDLALIRRHILNLGFLQGPYQLIAGDVNDNLAISTTDIAILRALILGIEQEFEFVPSWRFIPENYKFPDPENPFAYPIPYSDTICLDNESAVNVNFIGLKMGDVNGSAQMNRSIGSRAQALDLHVRHEEVERNEYVFHFQPSEKWITGQVFLEYDPSEVVHLSIKHFNGPRDYLHEGPGFIRLLYDQKFANPKDGLLRIAVTTLPGIEPTDIFALETDRQNLAATDWSNEREVTLSWIDTESVLEDCLKAVPNLWSKTISLNQSCTLNYNYRMINSYGQTMQEGRSTGANVEIGNPAWPAGLYLIEVSTDQGKKKTFKTIKIQ